MRFPAVRMFSVEINSIRKFADVEINQKKTKIAISPLGRKAGRIFHVGVLIQTDIREKSAIARISDKYGGYMLIAHPIYNSQPYAMLRDATIPCHVAVVGKPRTRDGFSRPFVKPEFVSIVSSKEAEIWEKEAMESTENAIKALEKGGKSEYPEDEVKKLIEIFRKEEKEETEKDVYEIIEEELGF